MSSHSQTPLQRYLAKAGLSADPALVGYLANLQQVASVNRIIARSIVSELEDQRNHLKLIASENFTRLPVQAAMGKPAYR